VVGPRGLIATCFGGQKPHNMDHFSEKHALAGDSSHGVVNVVSTAMNLKIPPKNTCVKCLTQLSDAYVSRLGLTEFRVLTPQINSYSFRPRIPEHRLLILVNIIF